MTIIELTEAEHFHAYKAFFTSGLEAHGDCFRITPEDEQREPFPTKGTPDSFTLGMVNPLGALVGVVSFERDGRTRKRFRHKGLLFRMYVAAEHGGKGIGRQLIDELLLRVQRDTDVEQINLTVVATNQPARKLYYKFGFRTFSVEKQAMKEGTIYYDEETMVLYLERPRLFAQKWRQIVERFHFGAFQ
jgi:RimJ/RimL family protein N-acetyltransferase